MGLSEDLEERRISATPMMDLVSTYYASHSRSDVLCF